MTGETPRGEYILAHQATLEAIAGQARNLLAANCSVSLSVSPGTDEPTFLTGEAQPELFQDMYGEIYGVDLPDEAARVFADKENQKRRGIAETSTITLLARCSINFAFEEIDRLRGLGYSDEEISANNVVSSDLLSYDGALFERALLPTEEDTQVEITRTTLKGLEYYTTAEALAVTLSDGYVDKCLGLTVIGDKIDSVAIRSRASSNPLVKKAVQLLGANVTELLPLLAGHFEDEDDLDEKLGNMWMQHVGQSTESEIGLLLEEARNQATSQKQFAELRAHLSQPSADELNDFLELLND